ncbi:MAG: Gfo/Idh/MocA family oxidoreductase [Cyanobacteria bacterium P01_H01_bin.74]
MQPSNGLGHNLVTPEKTIALNTPGKTTQSHPVCVIGAGNWGKNLVRNFESLGVLHSVCDLNTQLLDTLKQEFPDLVCSTTFSSVFDNPLIKGVVIATPSHTHYNLCKEALLKGKHVYVEKPIATTVKQTQELVSLAKSVNQVLMVGHLLLYHPAINRLKQLIDAGTLGQIKSISSDRLNTNPRRPDKSVLWDLAPHDVSILNYLTGAVPETVVSSLGYKSAEDNLVDDVHLDLLFPGKVAGHIHVSWVHPVKQVRLIVRGTEKTALMDDTLSENKLQLFNPDDMNTPKQVFPDYLIVEPLRIECQHFINCMRYGYNPRSDGDNGYNVVHVLESAEQVMEFISV